jgi:hypothetical protein
MFPHQSCLLWTPFPCLCFFIRRSVITTGTLL